MPDNNGVREMLGRIDARTEELLRGSQEMIAWQKKQDDDISDLRTRLTRHTGLLRGIILVIGSLGTAIGLAIAAFGLF